MPKVPRRKRFQINLSTAIEMMFVAGGIIWMNANAGSKVVGGGFSQRESYSLVALKYGWQVEFGWSDLQRKVEGYTDPEIEVPPDYRISWKPADAVLLGQPNLRFWPIVAPDA
jgi:hypothetical protein